MYTKLQNLCANKGISIYALEKAVGVSKGCAIKWKKSMPNAETLQKIADVLGCSTDYLLGLSDYRATDMQGDGNLMNIVEKILFLLKKQGKTQKELAAYADFSASAISEWKKNNSSPRVEYIPKIVEFLNVSADYLLGITDSLASAPATLPYSKSTLEIADLLEKLPESDKATIHQLIKITILPKFSTEVADKENIKKSL